MRVNLFWKIVLTSVILLLLIILVFKLIIEPRFVSVLQQSILDSSRIETNSISMLISHEIGNECSLQKVDQITKAISQKNNLTVMIIIPNCETGALGDFSRENYYNQPDIYEALGGKTIQRFQAISAISSVIQSTTSLTNEQKVFGAIQLNHYLSSTENSIFLISRSFYLSVFFLTIFSIIISFFIWTKNKRRMNHVYSTLNEIKEITPITEPQIGSIFADEISELELNIKRSVVLIQNYIRSCSSNNRINSTIFSNLSDGILVVDQNRKITLINQTAADFFNTKISAAESNSLAVGVRNFEVEEIFEKCVESQKVQSADIELFPNNRFIRCIATPLKEDFSGSVLFLLQDLTRIHQLEVVRQDFVGNVSHELRTPLAALKSLVETIQESSGRDPAATAKFLEMMNNEIDNLNQMVQELLELAKIESDQVPLEKKLHSPEEILTRAAERMRLQVERAKLKLSIQSGIDLPPVSVDFNRLEQVLINLIHNSLKFTSPGGNIELKAQRQDKFIVFSVKDTGIGISPKDLDRIFERFYKVDKARSAPGTGLGLSIARHLVEAHGGKIWAESIPTQGSTFYFSIPINK